MLFDVCACDYVRIVLSTALADLLITAHWACDCPKIDDDVCVSRNYAR